MVAGIIAEYNPFHNGHKLQIDYAKNTLGADSIVVALSPDFTQRGEAAIISKYDRAEIALKMGVDLVIQRPVNSATDSSMGYAYGGVKALDSLGIVDSLLFSAENDDMSLLSDIVSAELSESKLYKEALDNSLRQGLSYPSARENAFSCVLSDTDKEYLHNILSGSNNILAIEYIKAIKALNSSITPVCMKRIGSSYNDIDISGDIASATAIRNAIYNNRLDMIKNVVPECTFNIYQKIIGAGRYIEPDDVSLILVTRLLDYVLSNTDIKDINTGISHKIINNLDSYINYSDFKSLLKSKDITEARIARVLCHILLGITDKLYDNENGKMLPRIPYLYILGMSHNGKSLMSTIKSKASLPYFTTYNDALNLDLSDIDKSVLDSDIHATKIYNMLLANKTNAHITPELSRKFLYI